MGWCRNCVFFVRRGMGFAGVECEVEGENGWMDGCEEMREGERGQESRFKVHSY